MTTNIDQLPVIAVSAVTSRSGDCDLTLTIRDGVSVIDLTGIAFSLRWRRRAGDPAVFLDAALEGFISNGGATGGVHLDVPQARMATIAAATYVADLVATADGKTITVGTWTITHGAMGPCLITAITTTPRNAASIGVYGQTTGPASVSALTITPATVLAGTSPAATILASVTESYVVGIGDFAHPYALFHVRAAGGAGNRSSLSLEFDNYSLGNASDQMTPFTAIGRLRSGSGGLVFGGNCYAWVDAGVTNVSQATGLEVDTDIRSPILSKIGLTVADIATSSEGGSLYDAGIMIGKQAGGRGYEVGILFGYHHAAGMFGVIDTGTYVKSPGGTVAGGIDLSAATISGNAWASPGATIDGSGNLRANQVGFNGASAVGKQTLAASLPTDGSATAAQLATAINAIRTGMIAVGLGT